MQHYLETLNTLTTENIINIDDYYCVGMQSGIQLQARYTNELLGGFKNRKSELERFDSYIEDNGFIAVEFKYNGDWIKITLT